MQEAEIEKYHDGTFSVCDLIEAVLRTKSHKAENWYEMYHAVRIDRTGCRVSRRGLRSRGREGVSSRPHAPSYSSKGHPGGSASAFHEGCLGSLVSYKPLARSPGGKAYFVAHRGAQGKASSPFTQKYGLAAAAPSPAALRSRHEVLLSETSKPTPAAASIKPTQPRMTKTQHLTPARRGGTRA